MTMTENEDILIYSTLQFSKIWGIPRKRPEWISEFKLEDLLKAKRIFLHPQPEDTLVW